MPKSVLPTSQRPASGPQAMPPAAAADVPAAPELPLAGNGLRGLLLPLGLLTAGLVAIIVVLLLFAAREQNELALDASRHLAASVLGTQRADLQNKVRDYATWDETVDNVVVAPNDTWADDNIGTWAYEGLAIDATLAVDGAGAPLYAMLDGDRVGGADLLARLGHLDTLVAAARDAEVGELGTAFSAYVRLNGRLAIAAAAPIIRQDGESATGRGGAASVLVFFRVLDAEMLGELEHSFLLPGLRLLPADPAAAEGPDPGPQAATALLPLADDDGSVLANLAWQAERPGFLMLRALALPGALAAFIAACLLWVIVRRTGKATRALQDSHAVLQQQTAALRDARDQSEQWKMEFTIESTSM
jgi:sensor domain CHASE-containing protein